MVKSIRINPHSVYLMEFNNTAGTSYQCLTFYCLNVVSNCFSAIINNVMCITKWCVCAPAYVCVCVCVLWYDELYVMSFLLDFSCTLLVTAYVCNELDIWAEEIYTFFYTFLSFYANFKKTNRFCSAKFDADMLFNTDDWSKISVPKISLWALV